jgi:hypothetical protein
LAEAEAEAGHWRTQVPTRRARHLHEDSYYVNDSQQYLAKNPFGYRCHANTGVKFPADA